MPSALGYVPNHDDDFDMYDLQSTPEPSVASSPGENAAYQAKVEIFVEAVRFPLNAAQIYNREMENLRFLAWLVPSSILGCPFVFPPLHSFFG
jgi:hypothetical protein